MERRIVWMVVLFFGCTAGEIGSQTGAIEGLDAAPVCAAPDASPGDSGPRPTSGFWLRASPLRAEIRRGDRLRIEIEIVRAPGFVTPVVVSAFGLPDGTTAEPIGVAFVPEALVIEAAGLAPDATDSAFAIHASAGGRRDTLRATLSIVGPPIHEE
jgi:hypothetical protein